jgi:hypothetical protein
MARAEACLFGPLGWPSVIASATAGVATATKAAAAGFQHILSGVSISASGAVAVAVTVTLKDGTTVIDQWELPASAFAPIVIEYKRPFVITAGNLVELSIPSLGAAIKGTAVIRGLTVSA